jgi:DNA-binding response OmpR family regulator
MRKILLVDDDEIFTQTVEFALKQNNYIVSTAKNCEEAREKLKFNKADVILLDIMMPGTDGITFCKELRKDPAFATTPIIIVTAKGQREDVSSAIQAGADGYISKPFRLTRLLTRLDEILNKYGIA